MNGTLLPLRTRRLLLRRFTDSDTSAFQSYRSDPEIARFQSWDSCSAEEAATFVRQQSTQPFGVPGEWLQIAITLHASAELIGDCAVRVQPHDPLQATIAFTLQRSHQRRGFAFEAVTALLDALFNSVKLHRVIADTDPRNTPAWTFLERLGFRREGHFKQSLWFKGKWADEYFYAITRPEWQGSPA